MKNKHGVAYIGTNGIHSQGVRGGYEIRGKLRIDLPNGKWTAIYYYNNPKKYIPYNGGWYCHDELPAYMISMGAGWYVGTYAQIIKTWFND